MDYLEELMRARNILSVVNMALGQAVFDLNPDPNVISGAAELIRQLCDDINRAIDSGDRKENAA